MSKKICVVITARPSYSRIRSALYALREHPDVELQLVLAASALLERYGNVQSVIEADGFKINRRVHMIIEGGNLLAAAKSTGIGLSELATVFEELKPDMVVTIADRFETIATAISATYMNIPLAHIQGGEITGSIDEKVRHSITKLADLHLVSSESAARRVIRMGERPETVHATGCPSIDVTREAMKDTSLPSDLFGLYGGVGAKLDLTNGFLVVMQHPVTTQYKDSQAHINETLQAVDTLKLPTLWFWPNVDAGSDGTSKGIRTYRENHHLTHVHFFKNMPPEIFLRALKNSKCIIGNSSVAIRECSYLGVPAVNIGKRQYGRDAGANVINTEHDASDIQAAIEKQIAHGHYEQNTLYGDGYAGKRIADVLASAPLSIEKRLSFEDDY